MCGIRPNDGVLHVTNCFTLVQTYSPYVRQILLLAYEAISVLLSLLLKMDPLQVLYGQLSFAVRPPASLVAKLHGTKQYSFVEYRVSTYHFSLEVYSLLIVSNTNKVSCALNNIFDHRHDSNDLQLLDNIYFSISNGSTSQII